jgi:hypothetical protein
VHLVGCTVGITTLLTDFRRGQTEITGKIFLTLELKYMKGKSNAEAKSQRHESIHKRSSNLALN